jgi:hypothetical protein
LRRSIGVPYLSRLPHHAPLPREITVSVPAVEQRAGRRAPGPQRPQGDRLPAPVKERRPALAALAVLLILGGALASGLLVLHSGQRADYLVLRRTVAPGHQIRSQDLGTARIAGTGARAIPAGQRPHVIGQYATTTVYAGTLATRDMFSPQPDIPPGMTVVGVVLAPEQRPGDGMRPGDVVSLYVVPRSDQAGGLARVLVPAVRVVEVSDTRTGGGTGLPVTLLVPGVEVPNVEAYAALSRLAVVKLPAGTPLTLAPAATPTASAPAPDQPLSPTPPASGTSATSGTGGPPVTPTGTPTAASTPQGPGPG